MWAGGGSLSIEDPLTATRVGVGILKSQIKFELIYRVNEMS